MIRRAIRGAALLAGIVSVGVAGCASRDTGGKAPLPRPPAAANPSPYAPDRPLQPAPGGWATRDVVRVDSGRGYSIEVRDYLVPLDKPVSIDFGGVAVVEVRSGEGEMAVGDSPPQKVGQGFVTTVGEDAKLRVTARGEPMTLRAWIYR